LEAFVDRWEAKNHAYSPIQADLVNALIYAFGERWFPRPLQPLGSWIATYSLEDDFLQHVGIQPLRGIVRMLTHTLLKTVFFYKTRLAADSKVSGYVTRKTLTKEEYKAMDAVAAARADELGWHTGGKASLGLGTTRGGVCPVTNHTAPAESTGESQAGGRSSHRGAGQSSSLSASS
jgi:hypothetical protein